MSSKLEVLLRQNSKKKKADRFRTEFQKAWSKWLDSPVRDWQWALTLTFSNQRKTVAAAEKTLSEFVHRVNRRLYGKNSEKRDVRPGLSLVAVRERNNSQGVHYHLAIEAIPMGREVHQHLINDAHNLYYFLLREWTKLGGGEQLDLQPIEGSAGWLDYITKKVSLGDTTVNFSHLHK